jgi:hypothetical protein
MALPVYTGTKADKTRVKWKFTALGSIFVLASVIAALLFWPDFRQSLNRRMLDAPAIVIQVQALKELATTRYTLQRVVGLNEAKQPLGEESILLMVEGYVVAGVDLGDLVFHTPHNITMNLPKAKLISVYLDEKHTKVWDRHVTWWTPWISPDPQLETNARLAAIEDMRKAALEMGILDQAEHNAQVAIAGLLRALHLEVKFTDSGAT